MSVENIAVRSLCIFRIAIIANERPFARPHVLFQALFFHWESKAFKLWKTYVVRDC